MPALDQIKSELAGAPRLPIARMDSRKTKLHLVEEINTDIMKTIDIIAGTMTTLVYELLPYNKIIWILDTEYKHLEDLVEGGYAHKIRYEDLGTLDESYFKRTEVDANYFFSAETLKDTFLKYVLN